MKRQDISTWNVHRNCLSFQVLSTSKYHQLNISSSASLLCSFYPETSYRYWCTRLYVTNHWDVKALISFTCCSLEYFRGQDLACSSVSKMLYNIIKWYHCFKWSPYIPWDGEMLQGSFHVSENGASIDTEVKVKRVRSICFHTKCKWGSSGIRRTMHVSFTIPDRQPITL